MQEGKSATNHQYDLYKAALLLTALLLIIGLIGAFDVTFENPTDGANVSGTTIFNISVGDSIANVTNVTFYHNESADYPDLNQTLATVFNETAEQKYFNTTNDTTQFNDGSLWINATARNATHKNSTVIRVTVDNEKPSLAVVAPLAGAEISGAFNITATWSDGFTAVSSTKYNVTNSTGHIVRTGDLNDTDISSASLGDDGSYDISYNASDTVGNTKGLVDARTITVDNTKPNITVHTPNDQANLSGNVDVKATAADGTTTIDFLQYRWVNSTGDNRTMWRDLLSSNDTNFDTAANLDDGRHTLEFRANDTAGNMNSSVTRTVYVDNKGPEVSWTNPTSFWHTSDTINITAEVTDFSGVNLTNLTFAINGTDLTNTNNTWNATLPNAQFGKNYEITYWNGSLLEGHNQNVSINVTDISENKWFTLSWINFSVDTVEPNASRTFNLSQDNFSDTKHSTSLSADVLNYTSVFLNWSNVADATSGVDTIELLAKNQSFNRTDSDFDSWTDQYVFNGSIDPSLEDMTVSLTNGYRYEFWLRVNDSAGLSNTSNKFTVAIDTHAPQFATNYTGHSRHYPFAWTNESNPVINVTITDLVGITNTSIFMNVSNTSDAWDGVVNITGVSGWNKSMYLVKDDDSALNLTDKQTYNVTVNATDMFGQHAELFWNFTTDFVAPFNVSLKEFETAAETDGDWYRGNHTVQITCSDELSGPKDVAAFVNGTVQGDWNATSPAKDNLTLTKNGKNTYTFRCRDTAGNVNMSQNDTFHIDAETPTIHNLTQGGSVIDPGDKLANNFTLKVYFTEDESGIDFDASKALFSLNKLEGQSGSIDDFDWDDNFVEVDIDELTDDESYDLTVGFVDDVGNEATDSVEFRTKDTSSSSSNNNNNNQNSNTESTSSSGGGGDNLDVEDIPSSVSVVKGGETKFDLFADNIGTTDLDGITFRTFVGGGIDVSVDPDGFDLNAGKNKSLTMTVSGENATVGSYTARMYVEDEDGVLLSDTFDVEVMTDGPQVSVDGSEDIAFDAGSEKDVSLTVENTGSEPVENLAFSLSLPDGFTGSVSPTTKDFLLTGESTTVDLTVTAGDDLEWGAYNATFLVEYGTHNTTYPISLNVQPQDEAVKTEISNTVKDLESEFEQKKGGLNDSAADSLNSLIQEANTAIEEGDYAKASALSDKIEQQMGSAGVSTQGSTPLTGWAVLVLLGAGVILASGYVVIGHEERVRELLHVEEGGYRFEEPAFVEQIMAAMKLQLLAVVGHINGAAERVKGLKVPRSGNNNGGYVHNVPSNGGSIFERLSARAPSTDVFQGMSERVAKASEDMSGHVSRASDASQRMAKKQLPFASKSDGEWSTGNEK